MNDEPICISHNAKSKVTGS